MQASIIITQYNQAKLLRLTLLALSNQTFDGLFEIIICDDGSKTNTHSVVSDFNKAYPEIDVYYVWQSNKGFRAGQARNMGIRQAKGDVVILLDGDMIPPLNFVEQHIMYHKKHPRSILTGGRILVDDSEILHVDIQDAHQLISILKQRSFTNTEESGYRRRWYKSNKSWMSVFSCNVSFPNTDQARYSELFIGWGIEDWDFSLRMNQLGYEVHYQESILAYHIDYKPVISNAFRNNTHQELIDFAINLLRFIDQYPNLDLTDCAIALCSYQYKNDQWQWAGDGVRLRSEAEGISLLRNWLQKNNLYSRYEDFHIEPHFKASVIIACYEHIDFLAKIIFSLSHQYRMRSGFEIIITDDGSKNHTISDYKALLEPLAVPCKIIWQPKNGFQVAKSRNNGIQQSLGNILVLLDGDMIPEERFLEKHLKAHTRDANQIVAGNRLLLDSQKLNKLRCNKDFFNDVSKQSTRFETEEEFRKNVQKSQQHTWRLGFTCNVSLTRSNLVQFDENITNKFGHEDLELMYRLVHTGYKISYHNAIKAYHIGNKLPGYEVHTGATHDEIVRHLLTSAYVVAKHHTDDFLWAFLDCSRYFHLDKHDKWFFRLEDPKSMQEGLVKFYAWLLKNTDKLS